MYVERATRKPKIRYEDYEDYEQRLIDSEIDEIKDEIYEQYKDMLWTIEDIFSKKYPNVEWNCEYEQGVDTYDNEWGSRDLLQIFRMNADEEERKFIDDNEVKLLNDIKKIIRKVSRSREVWYSMDWVEPDEVVIYYIRNGQYRTKRYYLTIELSY